MNTEVMGSKGLGLLNQKGSRLVEFCQVNHLCIMNTMFDQHPRRKYTWIAPDGRTKNMIDHYHSKKVEIEHSEMQNLPRS